MKKNLLCFTLIIHVVCSYAQQKSIRSFLALDWSREKIEYEEYIFFRDSIGQQHISFIPILQKEKNISFGNAVFSYVKMNKKGKKIKEWQLSNLQIKRYDNIKTTPINKHTYPVDGINTFNASLAIAYFESHLLSDMKNDWQFWLGIGGRYYNAFHKISYKTSIDFPVTFIKANLTMLLVPRITYKIKKNIFLDIHSPLIFNELTYRRANKNNSVSPVPFLHYNIFKYHYIPKINEIRFGLGVNF